MKLSSPEREGEEEGIGGKEKEERAPSECDLSKMLHKMAPQRGSQ